MHNSAEMLLARKLAQENRIKDQQDRGDTEDGKTMMLFEKADQAYIPQPQLQGQQLNADQNE